MRTGYRIPTLHYECPVCHNQDAGYMPYLQHMEPGNLAYYRYVIGLYQDIHGYTSLFGVTK